MERFDDKYWKFIEKFKNRRFVEFEELDEGIKLNINIIKEFLGGNKIFLRDICDKWSVIIHIWNKENKSSFEIFSNEIHYKMILDSIQAINISMKYILNLKYIICNESYPKILKQNTKMKID